jgi:glutathione S-transferase
MLEDALAEVSGPWILGSDPTLADINLMPYAAEYLGLLDLWIKERPRVKTWWALAREWPSFKSGLHDLVSQAEFSEMSIHGPKIANEVAGIVADIRRNTLASRR